MLGNGDVISQLMFTSVDQTPAFQLFRAASVNKPGSGFTDDWLECRSESDTGRIAVDKENGVKRGWPRK
jgi:hypothetical protein